MDKIKFFRRRQFVLGSEHLQLEGWKHYEVADQYCLTIHPDLAFQQVKTKGKSLTLLGYLIDPYQVDVSEVDLLNDMLQNMNSVADVIDSLEKTSGRFIILAAIHDHVWLFNDAMGLRQVVYCKDKNDRIWCASQAETLAEHFGFLPDKEVINYLNSTIFTSGKTEFWLGNNRTLYKEISHLLPNHYLDITAGKTVRFWPTVNCIKPLTLQDGIDLSIPLLENSIKAAVNRFDLKAGISSGIDSRKTLAAIKEVKDKILCFTHEAKAKIDCMDVRVPARLLPKLGISHRIWILKPMSDEFRQYYFVSATCAREIKGNIAYTIYYHLGPDSTVLSSAFCEAHQCVYWLPKSNINGEGLAIISGAYHPLMINDFEKWLQSARPACEESGLDIMTLFYWEQRVGRWGAAYCSESDMVHDLFTPYNNRYLVELLLGINEKYRRNRMQCVELKTIGCMWPEVLSEPIYMGRYGDTFSGRLKELIRRKVFDKYITPWLPVWEYTKFLLRAHEWRARQFFSREQPKNDSKRLAKAQKKGKCGRSPFVPGSNPSDRAI